MAASKRPTEEDAHRAKELLLSGLARGDDPMDIARELYPLHPKNNTFPGELFLSMAVDAIDIGSFTREDPLDHENLSPRLLPELELRGRNDHRKSFYTLVTPPALRGGLQPDLLGEIYWWNSDDYWVFAMYALVIYVRASAEHLDVPVAVVCRSLAERHDIDPAVTEPWGS